MEVLGTQQEGGYLTRRSSTKRRQALRQRIRVLLVTVARDAAGDLPELLDLFQLPRSNATHATFLARSRKLLEQARAHQEQLVQHGLTATVPDDLAAALEEFDRSRTETAGGRQEHVSARAELDALSDEVSRLVSMLDGINRYRFEREPEKLIAWESARHVEAGPAPKDENSATSPGPSQAGPGEVKPAV
ncbi:MAG TPA: hypothetical protein VFN08_06095 [Gemmatimonadales bacterium]|jgi:hypothetical protein|nr:hypothetical protein [Gemmatimonadales bacterium]